MKLNILIDSSTKRSSKKNKFGESTVAWAAWWGDSLKSIKGRPIRAGVHYFQYEGPNVTFYEGVIRSLEQCLSLCWNIEVMVFGDCQPVIQQLNGGRRVFSMKLQYDQVQGLLSKYTKRNSLISFYYVDENITLYKKIDQLAKRSREHIIKILQ